MATSKIENLNSKIENLNSKIGSKVIFTYIEPTFSNGTAIYDMSSILATYGFTRLNKVMAQFSGGQVDSRTIRAVDVNTNNKAKLNIATTSSSISGVIGVFVLFTGL